MKILCSKAELINAINIVSKAVPTRTTMDILECILIDATAGQITFTGNDLELGIETQVDGQILDHGMVALDARLFSEIIRRMPEDDITIDSDEDNNTVITCEKVIMKIQGKDGEDFSRIPIIEKGEPIRISQFTLREMIRQTIFSIATNDTNKIMTGELFELNGNALRVISLDGHRISIRRLELDGNYSLQKYIVPGKTLTEISKILSSEAEDMAQMYFTVNFVGIEFGKTVVVSRLIEGNYFRVDQMISNDYETKITINRRELSECVERATTLVREDDKKPLVMTIADGRMALSLRSQMGSLDESIPVSIEGKDLKIGFNPRLIVDALHAIDDEEINIYFMNSKAPCLIKDDQGTYLYLILPVNFV